MLRSLSCESVKQSIYSKNNKNPRMNETPIVKTTETNLKTVSDSKRDFYSYHTRPINSVYRRVVEELLVEMHLLSVNADFKSDPIYYLGVVTSFERLMQGYRPEKDKESIFNAICKSVGGDPQVYKDQAGSLLELANNKSSEDLIAWLEMPQSEAGIDNIIEPIKAIAQNKNFKYSRLFGIGVFTLLEKANPELLSDEKERNKTLTLLSEKLNLPEEKLKKDIELYRSSLEKMNQLLAVIEDVLQADRKKRQKLEQKETETSATTTTEDKSESIEAEDNTEETK